MNSMSTISMRRLVMTIAGVAAAVGVGVVVTNILQPMETAAPAVSPGDSKPASGAPNQAPAALAAARQNIDELAAGLGGSPPPTASRDGAPEFDIVRIEPTGEAVVAGRAAPGSTVELLRNGEPHDRVIANQSGEFAMIPRPLPRGTYDLTLRAKQPDGKEVTSKQSVAVALEPTAAADEKPMVALMAPDKPTVVLSQPAAPAASAAAVDAVDVEPNGKAHVSGRARPGAAVRLYLNDSFVAPVTADADGRFAVTINQGVAPGNYRVRIDEVDSSSGKVRARAEVPFNVPDAAVTASMPTQIPATRTPAAAHEPDSTVAVATTAPDGTSPSAVVVPKIATITVSRGDSLWRISQRALGNGTRYATVFKANREQIRNPNLIYPGQVFVLPAGDARP
jgi:nucleoid-associated protein YgaU